MPHPPIRFTPFLAGCLQLNDAMPRRRSQDQRAACQNKTPPCLLPPLLTKAPRCGASDGNSLPGLEREEQYSSSSKENSDSKPRGRNSVQASSSASLRRVSFRKSQNLRDYQIDRGLTHSNLMPQRGKIQSLRLHALPLQDPGTDLDPSGWELAPKEAWDWTRAQPREQSHEMFAENQTSHFWLSLTHLAQNEHNPGRRRQQVAQNSERRFNMLALDTVSGTSSVPATCLLRDLGQVTSVLCAPVSFLVQ